MSKYHNEHGTRRFIVCAANNYNGVILVGARHWDSRMHSTAGMLEPTISLKPSEEEQGFIDQFGEFWSREDALDIVLVNKQVNFSKKRNRSSTELFSEGLY